jgi:UDP-glucuronate 4-epimerase
MLTGEKILITGATGKIAFPIARALAQRNEVWGAARLRDPAGRDRLQAAGITPVALDVSTGDFSALPDDFAYVFHAAVDTGQGDWSRCVDTNAQKSGELLYHCRGAKGFHHSHLLHLRAGGRGSGGPARDDVGRQADSAVSRQAEQLQPDL